MKNSILVTGSEGYIARHLKSLLPFTGYDLDGAPDIKDCISNFENHMEKLESIEVVIHLAEKRLQDINQDNLETEKEKHSQFIEGLKKLPNLKKVIFASSCSVYGQNENLIDETSPVNLTSHYAESKHNTEELLKSSGLRYVLLRFGTCYGGIKAARGDLFINQLSNSAIHQSEFEVFGADAWRPYVHVVDFARTLSYFAKSKLVDKDPVNVSQTNLTKRQILEKVRDLGLSADSIKIREDKVDKRNYQINSQKAIDYGVTFAYDFEKGLKQLIENIKNNSMPLI